MPCTTSLQNNEKDKDDRIAWRISSCDVLRLAMNSKKGVNYHTWLTGSGEKTWQAPSRTKRAWRQRDSFFVGATLRPGSVTTPGSGYQTVCFDGNYACTANKRENATTMQIGASCTRVYDANGPGWVCKVRESMLLMSLPLIQSPKYACAACLGEDQGLAESWRRENLSKTGWELSFAECLDSALVMQAIKCVVVGDGYVLGLLLCRWQSALSDTFERRL